MQVLSSLRVVTASKISFKPSEKGFLHLLYCLFYWSAGSCGTAEVFLTHAYTQLVKFWNTIIVHYEWGRVRICCWTLTRKSFTRRRVSPTEVEVGKSQYDYVPGLRLCYIEIIIYILQMYSERFWGHKCRCRVLRFFVFRFIHPLRWLHPNFDFGPKTWLPFKRSLTSKHTHQYI